MLPSTKWKGGSIWKAGDKSMTRSKYSQAREARRRAREVAGQPPRTRVIADKRKKPPKHKKLEEES